MLLAVHERDAYANLALDAELSRSHLESRDASLATELTYGTLRAQGTLDWVLANHSTRSLARLERVLLDALRLGTYQVLYSDVPDHAAVNEAVNQVRTRLHRGAAAYANAVLRAVAAGRESIEWPSRDADPVRHLAVTQWHPDWLVEQWIRELGADETEALCRADNMAPGLTLRVNTMRASRDEVLSRLRERGVHAEAGKLASEAVLLQRAGALHDLGEYSAGLVTAQDEGSMVVAHVVAPEPGETIVDMCAAPGGKATHLAEVMAGRGRVVAVDANPRRLELVSRNVRRLGDAIVEVVEADATTWRPPTPVDRVLLDAPCSGLGVLARRAEARWRKKPGDIEELAKLQARMLDNAAAGVRRGGVLVYSTCTISSRENQDQVAAFLARHDEFVSSGPAGDLGIDALSGDGWMQLLPHRNATDGIFIAKLERRESP